MSGAGRTEALAAAAGGGDARSYEELFARVADRLLLYVRLRIGRELSAKLEPLDVVQEVYAEAHRSFATFRPQGPGSFSRWLQRIARHRILDLAKFHGAEKRRAPPPLSGSAALDSLRARYATAGAGSAT